VHTAQRWKALLDTLSFALDGKEGRPLLFSMIFLKNQRWVNARDQVGRPLSLLNEGASLICLPTMRSLEHIAQSFSVHLPRDTVSSLSVGADGERSMRDPRVSSIPTRRKKTISNASVASSVFSGHAGTSDSQHTVLERPFSALGNHNEQEHRRLVRIPGESGAIPQSAITLQDDVEDDEEQERLEWERHPPVTPRGSLIQAREELAQQRKELSYWDSFGYTNSALDSPGVEPTVGMLEQGRNLHAIFEESDEEASLRRTNSLNNRKSVSSRQSSLRRPHTPMSKLDDAAIHCIEERSEHLQTASA
jgi:hypothetical protein